MIKTLRHLIADVRERLNAFSDDSNYTDEYIAYTIDNYRLKLVKQRLSDVRRQVSPSYKQLIELDLESYNGFLRSISPVPNLLDLNTIANRTALSSDNKVSVNFNMCEYNRLPYIGKRKHLYNQVYGAIGDDLRLYLNSCSSNYRLLSKVTLYGLFEDLEEAYKLSPDYDPNVKFIDSKYPIEPSMISDIIDTVYNRLINKKNIPEDKLNDADATDTQG